MKPIEPSSGFGLKLPKRLKGFLEVFFVVLLIVFGIILFIWALVTLMQWFIEGDALFEVIKDQWEWLKDLRIVR